MLFNVHIANVQEVTKKRSELKAAAASKVKVHLPFHVFTNEFVSFERKSRFSFNSFWSI